MSLGRMPLANGFLTADQFEDEYFFELEPAFCASCGMFQIIEQPPPESMFHREYSFFTRTSQHMVRHFSDLGETVRREFLQGDDPFVVEIGSNDGALLEGFAQAGIRHLGVDPSANIAAIAERSGVRTLVDFFNQPTAAMIADEHGQADAILAANVMAHIADLHEAAEGVARLLKRQGVLIFEAVSLGDMIQRSAYDLIYDEHVYTFSTRVVAGIFADHGLELIDVTPLPTHGGSMRYVLVHKGRRPVSTAVAEQLAAEEAQGLHLPETYDRFRKKCETMRDRLLSILEDIKQQGRRVAGYGASAKSTTVLNYCGIGPELIEFISDTTPIKQGKYSPGMHIPIRPHADFMAAYPDFALLFAWNHKQEIMAKEPDFMNSGGRWITFFPEVEVF